MGKRGREGRGLYCYCYIISSLILVSIFWHDFYNCASHTSYQYYYYYYEYYSYYNYWGK